MENSSKVPTEAFELVNQAVGIVMKGYQNWAKDVDGPIDGIEAWAPQISAVFSVVMSQAIPAICGKDYQMPVGELLNIFEFSVQNFFNEQMQHGTISSVSIN